MEQKVTVTFDIEAEGPVALERYMAGLEHGEIGDTVMEALDAPEIGVKVLRMNVLPREEN